MTEAQFIGKKISLMRKRKGLTQRELAERLDMKQQSISRIECGDNSTGIKVLIKVAAVLGAKIDVVQSV